MKKALFMLVLAWVAVAQPPTRPSAQTQPGAAPASQTAQPQQKTIKDPAEYNAYVSAIGQQDPNAKASGLESFLQQYPNSIVKEEALEQLMAAYQQTGNAAKTTDAANRLLQVNPNSVRALALLVFIHRSSAESGQNPQQNLGQARQLAERGLQAVETMPKQEGMSDQDFQKLKRQTALIFNGAIGIAALQTKDFPNAQKHLRAAVDAEPNDLRNVYPLALAYMTAEPPDDVNGLWYIARAANLAQGSPAQAQITDFARKRYIKFHGAEEGWSELLAQTKTTPAPPAGFTIAAAPPPPTPQEIAAKLVAENDVSTLAFGDREFILSSGNQQAADKVWSAMKGTPMRMQGKIVTASRTRLLMAVTQDNVASNTPDVEVNLKTPARTAPAAGSIVEFQGTPETFTPKPFLMTMKDGLVVPKAPVRKPAPRRRATRRG